MYETALSVFPWTLSFKVSTLSCCHTGNEILETTQIICKQSQNSTHRWTPRTASGSAFPRRRRTSYLILYYLPKVMVGYQPTERTKTKDRKKAHVSKQGLPQPLWAAQGRESIMECLKIIDHKSWGAIKDMLSSKI